MNGHDIAASTQVIINAWAIQRDPSFWEEPNEFYPERFLTSCVDFKGILFSTIGAELALANLIFVFDWALPDGAKDETLDMSEGSGMVIRRRDPLMAVATPFLLI
uniref:Uncharacterized protein n=1 Tax=Opuntia streptacantha TaxID=393608 RepID=A0A7C9EL55_OPUST